MHGLRKIARTSGPAFARLCRLSLAYNPLGPDGALALAATSQLAALRALDLSGTGIGTAGALAILESLHLPLRSLDLRDLGIDDDGARCLLSSGALARLETLDLSLNPISPDAASAMTAGGEHRTRIVIDRQRSPSGFMPG